jgi:hypothetical protein
VVQADEQAALLRQLEQGGVGPGWEPRDWLWRPTFLAASTRPAAGPLRLAAAPPAGAAAGDGGGGGSSSSAAPMRQLALQLAPAPAAPGDEAAEAEVEAGQYRQLLVGYLNGLAELDGAQRAVQVAADEALMEGYVRAIEAAVREQPGERLEGCSPLAAAPPPAPARPRPPSPLPPPCWGGLLEKGGVWGGGQQPLAVLLGAAKLAAGR